MTRTSGRFWLGLVIAAFAPSLAADAQEPTSAQALAAALSRVLDPPILDPRER